MIMGRFAFFDTHFEYKFVFGVQPSEDIQTFGGVASYETAQNGYLSHTWNQSETQTIETELNLLLQWIGEEPEDFTAYEKTIQGTWALNTKLQGLYEEHEHEGVVARYILGCLIYHQLLYNETLRVEYEP